MERSFLIISLVGVMAATIHAQEKKLSSKMYLLGGGYSMEVFLTPNFSFYDELGPCYGFGDLNNYKF